MAPPPLKRRLGAVEWLLIAIAVLLGGGGGLIGYLALRPAAIVSAAVSPSPSIAVPSPTATPTTQAPVASNPVKDWVLGGGASWMNTITEDFTAASSGGQTELRAGCVKLGQDVRSAQAYPPVPDAQAQADWSAALTQYAKGATDCVSGVDRHSSFLIARATSEFQTGQTHFQAVLDRLNVLAP